jgi:hypothetical protein
VKSPQALKKQRRDQDPAVGDTESQRNWPQEIVDPGGSWLPPACRRPAMHEWHGAGKTITKNTTRTIWYKKPGKDAHFETDVSWHQNTAMAKGAEMLRSHYIWEKRAKPPTLSEDGAEDSSYKWKVWEMMMRSSGKPLDWSLWSEQLGCPAGYGKWGTGHCGGVRWKCGSTSHSR